MTDAEPVPLRERQTNLTREAILEALARTVVEQGLHDFSVQDVADRAGVSHRTVYRHFPDRDALLDGLTQELDELFRQRDLRLLPESARDIAAQARTAFRLFGERPHLVRAVAIGSLATGTQPEGRARRDRAFREQVEEAASDLPDAEVRKASAVIRYLANSLAWVVLTQQLDLEPEEAAEAVSWAVDALLDDLEERTREARGE